MGKRTPAPGRGWVKVDSHGMLRGSCDDLGCQWGICASDMDYVHTWVRAHLRTEHADLWEPCWLCDGLGHREGKPGRQVTLRLGCPHCHGRGYIETERSES